MPCLYILFTSTFNQTKSLVQCERKTELSSQFRSFLVYKR
uniref:Uncharacterized protein n=1 Tax=Microviridae sp. ctnRH7 TaxID=2826745 RepID=A0A8S5NLA2_9VIRU|nr:MAG TPA: hypothetical protein [Microviridae sp. ctnRH7]